jgi:hypothetical protein
MMTVSEWIGSTEFWIVLGPIAAVFIIFSIYEKIDDRRNR